MVEKARPKNKAEVQKDEYQEAFDTDRIVHQDHPDLGFQTAEEIRLGQLALDRLIRHPDTSARVIGKYKQLLAEQDPRVKSKESRRSFLKRAAIVAAGVTGLSLGGYGLANEYTRQLRLKDIALQNDRKLGLIAPTPSYSNWTVRYLGAQETRGTNYREVGIRTFKEGDYLVSRQSVWESTWIKIYDFEKNKGDGQSTRVPKIHIVTKIDSGNNPTASEEWALRELDDTSDPNIDPRAIVLERRDDSSDTAIRVYLAIRKVESNNLFEARILRPISPASPPY